MAACHSRCARRWWTNGSRACAPRPEPPGGGRRSEAQTDRDRNELERLRRGLDAGVARLDEERRPLQTERHADAAVPAEARGRVGSHHGVAAAGIGIAPPWVADIARVSAVRRGQSPGCSRYFARPVAASSPSRSTRAHLLRALRAPARLVTEVVIMKAPVSRA